MYNIVSQLIKKKNNSPIAELLQHQQRTRNITSHS